MPAKLTQQDFINKAKVMHGDLYSYSKSVFTGINNTVEIKCNRCKKSFTQNARSHYTGRGCARCNASGGGSTKTSTEDFIAKAVRKHGDAYEYSKVKYTGAHSKVCITCKTHGEFKQSATSHLAGNGCPSCASVKLMEAGARKRITLKDWLSRFKSRHKNRYSYSEVAEIHSQYDKIPITCKDHGIFFQAAAVHSNGSGCPRCAFRLKYVSEAKAWMRGYEPQAFKLIVASGLAKASEVSVVCPRIDYMYAGRRKYTPDFWIESQNRIVEVKSIGTLGIKGSFASPKRVGFKLLAKLKAKRKGCIASGFKFSLLLMHGDTRLALPKNWYDLSIADLRASVNSQLHTRF